MWCLVALLGAFGCMQDIGEADMTSEAILDTPPGDCSCTTEGEPRVCGVDGVTYRNECLAFCAGTRVAYHAACDAPRIAERLVTFDTSECIGVGSLRPYRSENRHLAAVQLPIDDSPFMVTEFTFSLIGDLGVAGCNDGLAHRIDLYVQDDAFPDAVPQVVASIDHQPVPNPGTTNTYFTLALDQSFVVDAGKHLFFAIEAIYDHGSSTYNCLLTCQHELGPIYDLSFWSNSATTPYPWADLNSFGISDVPLVWVDGFRLQGEPAAF